MNAQRAFLLMNVNPRVLIVDALSHNEEKFVSCLNRHSDALLEVGGSLVHLGNRKGADARNGGLV